MFERGALALVPYPVTDLSAKKRRPVLGLTAPVSQGDFIGMPVTSRASHAGGLTLDSRLREGALPKPSWAEQKGLNMDDHQVAALTKAQNIIDMALTFTAMMRIFSEGSKRRIASKLERLCPELEIVKVKDDYQRLHMAFCEWFVGEIRTAHKTLKNGRSKTSRPASYGQAAKVFDIIMKVYVYYSGQPNLATASRITPFLHGAIDTPILNYLKANYPLCAVTASTIEQIDKTQYIELQEYVGKDIARSFGGNIIPVQYDDIMYNRLKRSKAAQSRAAGDGGPRP